MPSKERPTYGYRRKESDKGEKVTTYDLVTEKITQKLEHGTIPWKKPWKQELPQNLITKKPYRGINLLLLASEDYTSPYWLTFKQAEAQGGHVKRGEKGSLVAFWKITEKEIEEEGKTGKELKFLLRYYTIFNLDQCEGIKAPPPAETINPIQKCEAIVSGYKSKPELRTNNRDKAFYFPPDDYISHPPMQNFESSSGFYATLFHELTHSTGHEKRLGRFNSRDYNRPSARGLTTLWPVLAARSVCKDHLSAEIVRQLNRYRDHLNDLFGTANEPIIPNGPEGKPWRITTRQFRRTIAWHIANRPFGTIAGMIQYKHASVATFEGYAGSSKSGFRAEVENQRALGQLDDLLTYFDERQAGSTFSGPAAPRVSKALDAAAAALGPLPAMIADRARLRTMLASLARTLHVGVLADCFFDPGTAMCLKQATGVDNKMPLTALCQPTRCPNACITVRHRPAWARSADGARTVLKEKRLSPLQRTVLKQDLERIEEVLDNIDRDTNALGPVRSNDFSVF